MSDINFWFNDSVPAYSDSELKLFKAASSGQQDIVSALLLQHINPAVRINGFNSLHIAAKKNHAVIISSILNAYPNLDSSVTDDGRTALMIAAFEGNTEACTSIENHSSTGLLVDQAMNNALHYAVWGGNINTVRFIMDTCKIDASIPNKEGLLPVQLAAASNNVELVSLLNDSTDSRSASGYTSLHRACMYGALETVVSLSRDARVDVFAKTNTDQSALHLAAKGGYFAVVKYLVDEASLDINATDEFQLTPLHVACYGGFKDVVNFLLQRGADIQALNSSGSTPFHIAASAGKHEVCKLLVSAGYSNLFAKDLDGQTPIDLALSSGYKDLASKIALWSNIHVLTMNALCKIQPLPIEASASGNGD